MAFTYTRVQWQEILIALRNAISAPGSGWQIIDDQSALATNPYIVAAGEASDGTKMVLQILNPKNWSDISVRAYHDWDPASHLGSTSSPMFRTEINYTASAPQALTRIWVTATSQRLIIAIHGNYSRTDFQTVLIYFGEIKKYFATTDTKRGAVVLAATGAASLWEYRGFIHTAIDGSPWAPVILLEPMFATKHVRRTMAQFSRIVAPAQVNATPVVVSSPFDRGGIRGRLIDLYATSRVERSVAAVTPLTFRGEPFIRFLLKGSVSVSGYNDSGSFPVAYPSSDYFVPSSPDCGAYVIKAV